MIGHTVSHNRLVEKLGGGGRMSSYKAEDVTPTPILRTEVSVR